MEKLQNPFVVQCAGCRKIVADSFTLQTVRDGFLVHSHSTLSATGQPCPGKVPFDDCLVDEIGCACGSPLGFLLVSASAEWNGCAGMYAFDRDRVASYTLGNSLSMAKTAGELTEDIERLKSVVVKIYKKVFQ